MSEEIIRKTYLCPIIGSGTEEDARRPKIETLVDPAECSWFAHEFQGTGYCLCTLIAKASDHDIVAADPQVRLIATRGVFQISDAELVILRGQYPTFDAKFATARGSSVRFKGETGE